MKFGITGQVRMGSAIVDWRIGSGQDLQVWNRSKEGISALSSAGAAA